VTLTELRVDVVIVACAVSAGIHGAVAPAHFAEGAGAGGGFAAATVVMAALAGWLTLRPASPIVVGAAAATFAGLLAGYALAVTTGVPILQPDAEPVDGLALATKAVEAVGLVAATALFRKPVALDFRQLKGTLT